MNKKEIIITADKISNVFRTNTGNWAIELNNLNEDDENILIELAQSSIPIGNNSKETRDIVKQKLDQRLSERKK